MATVIGNLAQAYPSAAVLTDILVAPSTAITRVIISTIMICNQGEQTTFRLAHALSGAVDARKQYLAWDITVPANEVYTFEPPSPGILMGQNDVLRAYSANGMCSFNIYGQMQS